VEENVQAGRFWVGEKPREADWRLFTTLVRFDAVYHGHFKCNIRRLIDYPNLWAYTRELYQWPGVAATVNLMHIRRHYYMSHRHINPTGIVPIGPDIDFDAPSGLAIRPSQPSAPRSPARGDEAFSLWARTLGPLRTSVFTLSPYASTSIP